MDLGSLVQSDASMSLDVLIPADGDLPMALQQTRAEATKAGLTLVDKIPSEASTTPVTVQLLSYSEEGWNDHRLPGYALSRIDPAEFSKVEQSSGVVRIDARGPAARSWQLGKVVTAIARGVAASQHGWIYDGYRAQLHDANTLAAFLPDPAHRDVRAMLRIMSVVSTKGELDHVRTIGLWRLGLPELYVPNIPDQYLDDTAALVRATAQLLIQNDGVSRRGVIEVDLSKLPASWPRNASGTGKFTWTARWMRGPIHHNAMVIVLSAPNSRDKDPSPLVTALRLYAGIE